MEKRDLEERGCKNQGKEKEVSEGRREGAQGEKSDGKLKRGSCENVRQAEQRVMQMGGMEFAQKQGPRQMCSCQGLLFSLKTSFALCACFNTPTVKKPVVKNVKERGKGGKQGRGSNRKRGRSLNAD